MSLKRITLTILIILLSYTLFSTPSHASVDIHPFTNEVTIKNTEKLSQTVTFENKQSTAITITPIVFSYDAQNQQMIDNKTNIFVEIKEKTFKVAPNQSVDINYTITPFENLNGGTYFNLIVLRTDSFTSATQPSNVGITPNLSHLVVMNLVNDEEILKQHSTVKLEVVDNGIPFIRDVKIRYIMDNTSYYVVKPSGEIQIFNNNSTSKPIYFKINNEEKKVYPGGSITEEFSINQWSLRDIFYSREITGYFYNGIDNDYNFINIQQSTSIPIQVIFVLIPIVLLYIVIVVAKDIYSGIKRKTKR